MAHDHELSEASDAPRFGGRSADVEDAREAAMEHMPPSFAPQADAFRERERSSLARINETPLIDSTSARSRKSIVSGILQTITIFAVALLCTVAVKEFFLQSFTVPSGSMETTIMPGDYLMVNKLADSAEELHRGDIVVFKDPGEWLHGIQQPKQGIVASTLTHIGQAIGLVPKDGTNFLVKRIIGMGGDRVACCGDDGRITVNGVAIDESYVIDGASPSDTQFDVTVPEGYLWVMGDNRSNSADSRIHHTQTGFGFVPVSNVEGRAWLIFYPMNRLGILHSEKDVFAKVPAPEHKESHGEQNTQESE
ncbi:signal peptidase I [Chlamydia trachomatis]|nr:signal peptidase I [Chlamydia trachomatis]